MAAAIMLCAWNVAVIQLRLIFIQKKKGWMPPKGQLCFGIREKLFQAVRENDFHTVKCLFTAELLHFVLQNVMTNITICDNISR